MSSSFEYKTRILFSAADVNLKIIDSLARVCELKQKHLRELKDLRGPAALRSRVLGNQPQVKMPVDRSKWKVPELKAECRRRAIRVDGRKKDLIERLESYDRNDDFQNPPIALPSAPTFPTVNASSFRTVTLADKELLPKVRRSEKGPLDL